MSTQSPDPIVPHPIAALYQRSVLDPIVEVARAVAVDLVRRPRSTGSFPANVTDIIEGFRIATGINPVWPNAAQRAGLFAPIFGDAFRTTGIDLRLAALAFAERRVEMTPDPLADRVRDTAAAFRACLKAVEGPAVWLAEKGTRPVFQSAIELFRQGAVAGLFGLAPAPGGNWPFEGAVGAEAAATASLIEEIQRSLGLSCIQPAITQHLFLLLQRIAYYGAMTITGVLEDEVRWQQADWVTALVRNAYGWEQAVQASGSYIADKGKPVEPRMISRAALDDERLTSLPTEEGARARVIARVAGSGGGGNEGPLTCRDGSTYRCEWGQTCTTGFTYICDTGPTCTYGWTLKCDSGTTCISGWTFKCDNRPFVRLEPRVVSQVALDDEALKSVPAEEKGQKSGTPIMRVASGGLGLNTCSWGVTLLCDERSGPTCQSGWTFVCDTATCTYGWTLKCDKRVF